MAAGILARKTNDEWQKMSLCLQLRTREMYRTVEIIEK
jgi:hypothetical protein